MKVNDTQKLIFNKKKLSKRHPKTNIQFIIMFGAPREPVMI